MKKVKLFLPIVACVVAMLVVVSCKKGDVGPAGAAGPAGPAGATGAAGAAGAAGTANVIYSNWIDTATWFPGDTVHNGAVIDTVSYFTFINAPKLDLTMLNTGEIKVYVNAGTPTDPFVFPLPYNDGSLFIDVSFYLNTIQLLSNGDLTGIPFRYILIPGGTTARKTNAVDWNNYAAVQKYLGLKD